MRRVFGAVATFGGWLCLPLGGLVGFAAGGALRLDAAGGRLAPSTVYGVPGIVVLWLFLAIALLAAAPLLWTFASPEPTPRLYAAGGAMAVAGLVLLPDELGRSFALALFPGAALLAGGGWLLQPSASTVAATAEPTTTGIETAILVPEMPVLEPDAPATVGAGAVSEPVAAPSVPAVPLPESPAAAQPDGSHALEPGVLEGEAEEAAAAAEAVCPWCSTAVAETVRVCPACGASLRESPDAGAVSIAGLTTVDPDLRSYAERAARAEVKKRNRGGLRTWLRSLDDPYAQDERPGTPSAPAPAVEVDVDPQAFLPPSAEVRAEMARIALEPMAGFEPDTSTEVPAAEPAAAPRKARRTRRRRGEA